MESELVQQVGSNARLILHHCKSQPNKVLRHIVAIVSQLPNIIRCNFQDVSKLLALLPSGQDTDFRCVMLQEIEFNLDECPNKRHAELQVHPLWVEIRREVAEYLLGDLCGIVMEYVKAYSQRFYVGLIVKTYTEDQWYVGRITKIATVQGIPFLFIEYYMHEFDCSDWIPATSANVKCFYNSRGERIEKAKFLSAKEAETYDEIEMFNANTGEFENCLFSHSAFFSVVDVVAVRTFMV